FIPDQKIFEIAVRNEKDEKKLFHFFIFNDDSIVLYTSKLLGSGLDCGRDECMVGIDPQTNDISIGGRQGIAFHLAKINSRFVIDTVTYSFNDLKRSNKYITSRSFRKIVALDPGNASLDDLYTGIPPANIDELDKLFDAKYKKIKQEASQNNYSLLQGYTLDSIKKDINEQGIYEKRIGQYYDIAEWLIKARKSQVAQAMINFFYDDLEEDDKKRGSLILASIGINRSQDKALPAPVTDQNVKANNDRAYQLEQAGKYQEAVDILVKVIQTDPNRVVAYLNIADAYWGLNDKTRAKENYNKYIDLMKTQQKDLSRIPKRVYDRTK
ncbi:MAG: tetratricopeptide repeat protein, partial [Chitinophagaceae bacterium]|nr:tetratricopeptide repeat protein [Chitinophagaceae bacterium]